MKKIILGILLLFLAFGLYSKSTYDKIVNSDYTNSEFVNKNPLFISPEFYFPDLKYLNGKILKVTVEKYDIINNGYKVYGDSDIRSVTYIYYVFNKKGIITDSYEISVSDSGFVEYKFHTTYNKTNDGWEINERDFVRNKINKENVSVCNDEGKIIFSKQKNNILYKTIIESDKIEYTEFDNEKNKVKRIYNFDKNTVEVWEYINIEKGEVLNSKSVYKNGVLNLQFIYLSDGSEVYRYIYETNGKDGIGKRKCIETRNGKSSEREVYLERQFCNAGFMDNEVIRPFRNGADGYYNFIKRTILNESDELFNKYFLEN